MNQYDQREQQVAVQYNAGRDIFVNASLSEEEQRHNRDRMLEKVRAYWIVDLLERFLYKTARIELAWTKQPEAVMHPEELVSQTWDQRGQTWSAGAHITDLYNKAGGELLILGEPGAGKTTLLLELARDLLNRAEQDSKSALPVIFNLSSWSIKRAPLLNWLIEELNRIYGVPLEQAQKWIEKNQLLLLLDGLDEIPAGHLSKCVETINIYHHEYGLAPIVICSRKTDYFAQTKRLKLHMAVVVQPLTKTQIEIYLSRTGKELEAIQMVLSNDPILQEMATSPLLLSILARTYAGRSLESLEKFGLPKTRQDVFTDYIAVMLQHRNARTRYPFQQTIDRLAWLAWQLARHNQPELYLERIQPDWLEGHQRFEQLYRMTVRVSMGLSSALILGLVFWLFAGLFIDNNELGPHGPLTGLLIGTITGLILGLTHKVEKEIKPAEVVTWSWKSMWHKLTGMRYIQNALLDGLIAGSVFGLIPGWIFGLKFGLVFGSSAGFILGLISGLVKNGVSELLNETIQKEQIQTSSKLGKKYSRQMRVFVGQVSGVISGLIFGLSIGLLIGWQRGLTDGLLFGFYGGLFCGPISGIIIWLTYRTGKKVRSGETIGWLQRNIWKRLIKSEALKHMLIVGLIIGLFFGLYINLVFGLFIGFVSGLLSGLVFEFISGIVGGLSSNLLDKKVLIKPNQGMRQSARNSILVGLIGGLVSILLFGLVISTLILLSTTNMAIGSQSFQGVIFFALVTGLPIGVSLGLSNGGEACIQYMVLKIFLWGTGDMPWNYANFLDYAVEHVLLRKVGGGYIFVHGLLLEHFVSIHTKSR